MPSLYGEIRQPNTDYILIPRVTSETRLYIPMAIFGPEIIAGDVCLIPNATLYHLGILTSLMHMAWMRAVCGRLEGRYRYSNQIVYNNYPWPDATSAQKEEISKLVQAILDARAEFLNATLGDLYDPNTMPPSLLKAHQALDRAIDKLYRKESFLDERTRVEFLFDRYLKLLDPLAVTRKTRGGRKGKN
jgi:hypothetical protein